MRLIGRASDDRQPRRFVILDGLRSCIGDRLRSTRDHIAEPKGVLFLCNFADSDEEFSLLVGDRSLKAERITKVGMAALIERTGETDSRLNSYQGSSPCKLVITQQQNFP